MADTKTILILGGVGLGVLALLAYASPAESNIQVNPQRGPLPPARRPGDLPPPETTVPGAAEAIESALAALGGAASTPGTPMTPSAIPSGLILEFPALLIQGQRYKSRLQLSGLTAGLAPRDLIKSTLEGTGFSNVTVYMTRNELPAGWPAQALANVDNGSRWAEGTWSAPTQTVEKPSNIQNAWTA